MTTTTTPQISFPFDNLPVVASVADVDAAVAASVSENTWRVYRSGWRRWTIWAQTAGVSPIPAEPEAVARYAISLHQAGAALPTIRQAMAAITKAHRSAKPPLEAPTASDRVRQALRGLARQQAGRQQRQAAALTDEALDAIIARAYQPRRGRGGRLESRVTAATRGAVDVALALLTRDAGLRRSEAASLMWSDLQQEPDGSGRLLVRRSKTDVSGEGAVVYVGRRAMRAVMAIRPEPLPDVENSIFGMSTSQISRRIAAAARAAGLGEGYSGHSGRVGLARKMARAGAPDSAIERQGRWKAGGAMVGRYTRNEVAAEAARYLD